MGAAEEPFYSWSGRGTQKSNIGERDHRSKKCEPPPPKKQETKTRKLISLQYNEQLVHRQALKKKVSGKH